MSDKILEALKQMDVGNDTHWTADGLPKLETVRFFASDQSLSREDISNVAPKFKRSNPSLDAAEDPVNPMTAPPAQPAPAIEGAPAAEQAPEAAPAAAAPEPAAQASAPPAQPEAAAEQGANPAPREDGVAGAPQATADANDGSSHATENEGQAEQPEVEDGPADHSDELSSIAEELEGVEAELENIDAWVAKAQEEQARLRETRDDLVARQETLLPSENVRNTNAIQGYLAAQTKILEARGEKKLLLKESGLDLKELARDLKSPLDAAMARKTGRGTQRPTRG